MAALYAILVFQPTPPRGRRRPALANGVAEDGVSTHASAREATRPRLHGNNSPPDVSTHASAREATGGFKVPGVET